MFKIHIRLFTLLLVLLLQGCESAALPKGAQTGKHSPVNITDIRMWHAPERSRIVLDMDRHDKYKVLVLENPHRVAIDLYNTYISAVMPADSTTGQFIRHIREVRHKDNWHKNNSTRIVFELNKPTHYSIQRLTPNAPYSYRLVIDFRHRKAVLSPSRKSKSEVLILIDPGHGGEDPGAVGARSMEKKVVLQIAKKLEHKINRIPGMRAQLTRTGDYYVSLSARRLIARKMRADFFISLHADSFRDKHVRGSSLYTLSQSGASSSSAKWLANRENASDLIGGVNLADEDAALAEMLLGLSMTQTINDSIDFGRIVLNELKKIGRVHNEQVERAEFAVLKSPDIPSILVETAYISNPQEEKLLLNSKHQHRIAAAIVIGIRHYIAKNKSRYATL